MRKKKGRGYSGHFVCISPAFKKGNEVNAVPGPQEAQGVCGPLYQHADHKQDQGIPVCFTA